MTADHSNQATPPQLSARDRRAIPHRARDGRATWRAGGPARVPLERVHPRAVRLSVAEGAGRAARPGAARSSGNVFCCWCVRLSCLLKRNNALILLKPNS